MLELHDITKVFACNGFPVTALCDVSLTIGDREYVRLEGPNGSGKTTLFRIVGGDVSPDAGRVVLDGVDITRFPPYRRQSIARIFQDAHENSCDELTVLDTLALSQIGQRPHLFRAAITLSRRHVAERALGEAGMDYLRERLHEPLRNLSGGERQVLNVLFLKIRDPSPSIVLADEPTNHLDPENARRVLMLLRQLAETRAVVLVSHAPIVEEGVTRVVRLDKGEVIDERLL